MKNSAILRCALVLVVMAAAWPDAESYCCNCMKWWGNFPYPGCCANSCHKVCCNCDDHCYDARSVPEPVNWEDTMKVADKNKDKKLSLKEAQDYLESLSNINGTKIALKDIQGIDTNKDGFLTLNEIDPKQ